MTFDGKTEEETANLTVEMHKNMEEQRGMQTQVMIGVRPVYQNNTYI